MSSMSINTILGCRTSWALDSTADKLSRTVRTVKRKRGMTLPGIYDTAIYVFTGCHSEGAGNEECTKPVVCVARRGGGNTPQKAPHNEKIKGGTYLLGASPLRAGRASHINAPLP